MSGDTVGPAFQRFVALQQSSFEFAARPGSQQKNLHGLTRSKAATDYSVDPVARLTLQYDVQYAPAISNFCMSDDASCLTCHPAIRSK